MAISKIFKFVWLISFMAVSIVLFYVYSGLPEMVVYSGDESTSLEYIGKDTFFYFFLIVIGLLNILLYAISDKMLSKSGNYRKLSSLIAWKFGLGIVVNIFLTISMVFISIFNSGERFDYSNFGYLVYFSLALVVLWVISLPFVIFSSRIKI